MLIFEFVSTMSQSILQALYMFGQNILIKYILKLYRYFMFQFLFIFNIKNIN